MSAPSTPKTHQELFEQEIEAFVSDILPATYHPQKVRDDKVIRDAIWGFSLFYKHEINIIDSPLLQRLRGIFQTSLAIFTYPSANHTRFEHSLGATCVAHKVLSSLHDKVSQPTRELISKVRWAEVRLAALLHDCGHGPFSHGTEEYFKRSPLFDALRNENPTTFGRGPTAAAAGEIFSYFIIKSQRFKDFWREVVHLYAGESTFCELSLISPDRIALMILGKVPPEEPEYTFLAKIINGPFDVDKLDYLPRDGYFTGLHLEIDIERLLLSMDLWKEDEGQEHELCIDIAGVVALEQLLFSKMVIFHSVYHHHKVRASVHALSSLLDLIKDGGGVRGISLADPKHKDPNGKAFPNPFSFLRLDDYDIFNCCHHPSTGKQRYARELNKAIQNLKNRNLLKRAAVLYLGAMKDKTSEARFAYLQDPKSRALVEGIRKEIAAASGQKPGDVVIDIPDPPRFERISLEAKVRLSNRRAVPLEKAHPTRGWVTGYAEFKYRVHVLARAEAREKVGKSAIEVFAKHKIHLRAEALELAKQRPAFVLALFPRHL